MIKNYKKIEKFVENLSVFNEFGHKVKFIVSFPLKRPPTGQTMADIKFNYLTCPVVSIKAIIGFNVAFVTDRAFPRIIHCRASFHGLGARFSIRLSSNRFSPTVKVMVRLTLAIATSS